MSKYIDADKVVITAERGISADGLIFIPMIDVHRSIEATPTADVVEVRHGHWVHSTKEVGVEIYHRWQCSLCGRTVARRHSEDIEDLPYCHCGAKMDGERKQENGT